MFNHDVASYYVYDLFYYQFLMLVIYYFCFCFIRFVVISLCFVYYYIFHFSLQTVFHLIHFFFAWFFTFFFRCCSCFYRSILFYVLFSNGFTLFFDSSWFVFIIPLHFDIWSNNEFTSWYFSFKSLCRKRIWLSKWPINLSEWFSVVFAILDCNRSFLKIITFFNEDFF